MNIMQHITSLENSNNAVETLNWKLETINTAGLPAQSGMADYIALALDNLDAQVKQLDAVALEIKARKDAIKSQKNYIQEEAAKFILGMGIDRLEGAICSSITITKGKEETTKEVSKFKLLCSDEEMKAFLVDAGLAVFEKELETKPATADKVKINKRKVHIGVIEDVD